MGHSSPRLLKRNWRQLRSPWICPGQASTSWSPSALSRPQANHPFPFRSCPPGLPRLLFCGGLRSATLNPEVCRSMVLARPTTHASQTACVPRRLARQLAAGPGAARPDRDPLCRAGHPSLQLCAPCHLDTDHAFLAWRPLLSRWKRERMDAPSVTLRLPEAWSPFCPLAGSQSDGKLAAEAFRPS